MILTDHEVALKAFAFSVFLTMVSIDSMPACSHFLYILTIEEHIGLRQNWAQDN